jgi:hypothetical protein
MAYFKPCNWIDISPSSGGTVNIAIADAGTTVNVIVNNSALLAALTFVFPITGVADGQIVKISAKSAITLVTMNVEAGGALLGALTGLLGGGSGIYQFRASNSTWYKF